MSHGFRDMGAGQLLRVVNPERSLAIREANGWASSVWVAQRFTAAMQALNCDGFSR